MSEKPKLSIEAEGVSAKPTGAVPKPAEVGDINIAPTTTAAHDLTTAGQRRVNLIWETMQASIAAAVVGTTLFVASRLALLVVAPEATDQQSSIANTAFMLISNLVSLIIGFYFGRTNHQKEAGVQKGDIGR